MFFNRLHFYVKLPVVIIYEYSKDIWHNLDLCMGIKYYSKASLNTHFNPNLSEERKSIS